MRCLALIVSAAPVLWVDVFEIFILSGGFAVQKIANPALPLQNSLLVGQQQLFLQFLNPENRRIFDKLFIKFVIMR